MRLLLLVFAFASSLLTAKEPEVNFVIQKFWNPQSGNYLEIQVWSEWTSLQFKAEENGYSAGVNITIALLRNDSVFTHDRFNMLSGTFSDTAAQRLMAHITRIAVDPGNWNLILRYSDINSDSVYTISDSLHIHSPQGIEISELTFNHAEVPFEDWLRYGRPSIPRSLNGRDYFRENDTLLDFYIEVYQMDTSVKTRARYGIKNANTGEKLTGIGGEFNLPKTELLPLSNTINLTKIPSGTYVFYVDISDDTGRILAHDSILFGNVNPGLMHAGIDLNASRNVEPLVAESDSLKLDFYLDCLHPIAFQNERQQIRVLLEEGHREKMNMFLTAFWLKRNPGDPKSEWATYLGKVHEIDGRYGTGRIPGHKTDRGRVALQYGEPTRSEQRPFESNAYPYEIWQYDRLMAANATTQINKVFIFVSNQMATQNYDLIHSDAIGEPYDPQWKFRIARGGTNNNPDYKSSQFNEDPFGSRLNNNSIINSGTSNRIDRR